MGSSPQNSPQATEKRIKRKNKKALKPLCFKAFYLVRSARLERAAFRVGV